MIKLYRGDCLRVLKTLPSGSVHCVVTSPPYWGLRDYGVKGQLGLEPTPEAYVERTVAIFREVRRVLRDDGTLWLNMGDSYSTSDECGRRDAGNGNGDGGNITWAGLAASQPHRRDRARARGQVGLPPKNLVGIPWRLAFALQADGWYLRSDIIWHKPNPMPESVRDRPTKSHEYLFLLSKSQRYYFDADAVKEVASQPKGISRLTGQHKRAALQSLSLSKLGTNQGSPGRNIRSVWTIPTRPYKGAHFATFPPKLVIPCVKAGTSERGCCPECGKPWKRVVERTAMVLRRSERTHSMGHTRSSGTMLEAPTAKTIGWVSTCNHHRTAFPSVVLDPFAGSGTTGAVCVELGRDFIGIDLNPKYLTLARKRIKKAELALVT